MDALIMAAEEVGAGLSGDISGSLALIGYGLAAIGPGVGIGTVVVVTPGADLYAVPPRQATDRRAEVRAFVGAPVPKVVERLMRQREAMEVWFEEELFRDGPLTMMLLTRSL